MSSTYVLDAFALLAFLTEEPGAAKVAEIVRDPDNALLIGMINLGEVYYILTRRRGAEAARSAEEVAFAQPRLEIVPPTWERVRAAAAIKASAKMSFADSFAASLTTECSGRLVTADREFEALERRGMIQVLWLDED